MSSYEVLRPLRVFLCHSSNDKHTVRTLYQRLLTETIEPWLDEEKLLPGQNWEHEILRAINNSDVVIVCLSHVSINKEGYLQKEIKLALDAADCKPENTIFIIPLKLEECQITERLRRWHYVNYFEGERGYQQLMKALRHRATTLGIILPSFQEQIIQQSSEHRPSEQKVQILQQGLSTLPLPPTSTERMETKDGAKIGPGFSLQQRVQIYEQLKARFDLEELRTLCFELGVDYDNLRGEGKSAKMRELITYLQHRRLIYQLISKIEEI